MTDGLSELQIKIPAVIFPGTFVRTLFRLARSRDCLQAGEGLCLSSRVLIGMARSRGFL